MKQHLVIQNRNPDLALFFAGWGMDAHPFSSIHLPQKDLLICYDYRSLDFDFSIIEKYSTVIMTAWSMGVWAADRVFAEVPEILSSTVAINGTLYPVDQELGIPPSVFAGTMAGLNASSLQKFYRRMCGSQDSLEEFLQNRPLREVEELRDELKQIALLNEQKTERHICWDKAIICQEDAIFSCVNQKRAWAETPTEIRPGSHFQEEIIKQTIGRNG